MKQHFIFLLILMFLTSFLANAQMMRMNPKERTKELKEKLKLTEEQAEKVEEIFINAENEIKSKVQGSGNREQMREAMDTIMNNIDIEILQILNDEQKGKYNEMIQERKERMPMRQRDFN